MAGKYSSKNQRPEESSIINEDQTERMYENTNKDVTADFVPMGDFTEGEMATFMVNVADWLWGGQSCITQDMSDKELRYIFSHFKMTEDNIHEVPDGHLYRIESAAHHDFDNIHVNDKLKGDGALRSFSRKIEATNRLLGEEWGYYDDIVIYRTNGNTPYFNATDYVNPFPHQEECFVPLDTMRVVKTSKFSGEGMANRLKKEYGLDLGDYENRLGSVTVVDVHHDSSIKYVEDSDGRLIEM